MRVDDIDVGLGIRRVRSLIRACEVFREDTSPMVSVDSLGGRRSHPMDDVLAILDSVERTLLGVYGKTLWEGAEGMSGVLDE